MPVDVSTAPGAFRSLTGRSLSPSNRLLLLLGLYQLQNSLSIGPKSGSPVVPTLPGGRRKIHALGFEQLVSWPTFYFRAETQMGLCLVLFTLFYFEMLYKETLLFGVE
jgi:hypothetical protein